MKTCEEMTRCVLEARDRHLVRRQKQRKIALRCSGSAVICAAAIAIAYPMLSDRNYPEKNELDGAATTGVSAAAVTVVPDELSGSPSGSASVTRIANDRPAGALTDSPSGNLNGGLDGDVTNAASSIQPTSQPTESVIRTAESTLHTIPTTASETEPPVITTEPVVPNTEKPVNTAPPENTRTVPEQMYNGDGTPVPHWDEKSFDQKYGWAGFGELGAITTSYFRSHETVDSAQIGELLGTVWLGGYDEYTDEYKHSDAEAYAIIGIDAASEIAVRSPDDAQYYLFRIHDPLAGADDSPSGGDGN